MFFLFEVLFSIDDNTLRKTQITAMHEAGADLATIAKQSGHKNLETINKHYLEVSDRTVYKYL
ncbi:tyrosine-type recombinase/integrase [Psychrobacillus sp. FSL H8-0483]|uniref:tyrosine-type recombinase/integrase n=1 Tax=Psychrobacillus sp. FSL H8-0483 TaxID=2921389 RepID=UPI00315A8C21